MAPPAQVGIHGAPGSGFLEKDQEESFEILTDKDTEASWEWRGSKGKKRQLKARRQLKADVPL